MSPQVERTPPYLQVLTHLRRQIESGEVKPGERISSARQLAEEWGISRPTAAKALSALQAEGLIETSQTGARARGSRASSTGGQRFQRVLQRGRMTGTGERSEGHEAAVVQAPERVALALGIEVGAPV